MGFVLFLLRSEDRCRGNINSRSGSFRSLFAFYNKSDGMFAGVKAGNMPYAFGALLAGKIVVGVNGPVKSAVDPDLSFSAIAVPVSFQGDSRSRESESQFIACSGRKYRLLPFISIAS